MEDKLALVVEEITRKRELSNLEPAYVQQKVVLFLKKNPNIAKKMESAPFLKFKRSKEFDLLKRTLRCELRKLYGVFIERGYNKRFELLEERSTKELLRLHKSSSERLEHYEDVYKKIFSVTQQPASILDLACGLNPLSYEYLGCAPIYFASDISEKDLNFIQKFFDVKKIKGSTKRGNLLEDDISSLSKDIDVTFLFKTLDGLESVKRGSTKKLLSSILSKHIVVSFPTKSIGGGKKIKGSKRNWFTRIVKELGWKTQSFEIPGEVFFILCKDKKD